MAGPRQILTRVARKAVSRVNRADSPLAARGYLLARQSARRLINGVTSLQVGWVASLQWVRWVDESVLELGGWAFERGYGFKGGAPEIQVWLEAGRRRRKLAAEVELRYDSGANAKQRWATSDLGNTGFTARIDVRPLLALAEDRRRTWNVRIEVSGNGHRSHGWFKSRATAGSAGHLTPLTMAGVQLLPVWSQRRGLGLELSRPPALVELADLGPDRSFTAVVRLQGVEAQRAYLRSPQGRSKLQHEVLSDGRLKVTGEVIPIDPAQVTSLSDPDDDEGIYAVETAEDSLPVLSHRLMVLGADGKRYVARTSITGALPSPDPVQGLFGYCGPGGTFRLRDTPAMMSVGTVEFTETPEVGIRLTGRALGDLEGAELIATGTRQTLEANLEIDASGDFVAFFPLVTSKWNQAPSAPYTGRYTVRGLTRDGQWFRVAGSGPMVHATPIRFWSEWFKLRVGVGAGRRLRLIVTPPVPDKAYGPYNQRRLLKRYVDKTFEPIEAVYLESFYGRQATCNPLALDREIARRYPDMPRYWGVVDRSVAVPEGAIPVVQGTGEWFEARGKCRYVIANDWLRRRFIRQPFQIILQTWHGSMLKRIGLDRPNILDSTVRAIAGESHKWDVLLSQNAHSTEIFRRSYDWDKPIWEEGYPRNDAMVTGDGAPIRERLGIRPDQKAILYAPTWRDNAEGLVQFLDLEQVHRQLGDSYVLLLRGHSRTLQSSARVQVPGVIDVTTYPNVTELFMAADALITDYSSVMFDFSVTARPMIFFVPDMDDYRDSVRGVYFDLSTVAPGPVLGTQDQVIEAIRRLDADRGAYAELYEAWRARFNGHDDGHSAERVIDRFFAIEHRDRTDPPPFLGAWRTVL